jgi:predicted MarR family transcription regulator
MEVTRTTMNDDDEIQYRRAIALLEATMGDVSEREIAMIRSHDDAKVYADWVASTLVSVINRELSRIGQGPKTQTLPRLP